MKTFILSLAVLLITTFSNATTFRIGYIGLPIPGIDFGFTNQGFYDAQNAANNGDTIQVYQQFGTSPIYLDIYKSLQIIGFGHSLDANPNLQISNNVDSAYNAVSFTLQLGSSGTLIQGLNLSYCNIYDSNITIKRCRFKSGYSASYIDYCTSLITMTPTSSGYITIIPNANSLTNISISGCYFDGGSNTNYSISFSGTYSVSNLIISNNYFNNAVTLKSGINGQINGVFANNIMNFKFQDIHNQYYYYGNCANGTYYSSIGSYKYSQFDYFLIKNNIFNSADTFTCCLDAPNSIIQNNVFSCAAQYACPSISSTGNIYSANMQTVFGPTWNDGLVYNDNQLSLGTSSPAINAGIKGNNTPTNCGIFGGEAGEDYKLSGIPSVPSFYLLSTPSINATTNPYNITISVKSNN